MSKDLGPCASGSDYYISPDMLYYDGHGYFLNTRQTPYAHETLDHFIYCTFEGDRIYASFDNTRHDIEEVRKRAQPIKDAFGPLFRIVWLNRGRPKKAHNSIDFNDYQITAYENGIGVKCPNGKVLRISQDGGMIEYK
jgi:hypothetical protein